MIPHYWIYEVLKSGSKGEQVIALQRTLPLWASGGLSLEADGVFGSKTEDAVKKFQTAMKLNADGVVGKATSIALRLWVTTELGFDASRYNDIDWSKIDTSNYKFCNLKATEGATYTDPTFNTKASAAISRGLDLGVYHYTKFKNSPIQEVDNLATATYPFRKDISMYFLDLEERETSLSSSEIFQWVRTFLETSASRFGRSQIGIYTSSNYLREKNLQSYDYLSQYHLWAASWSSQPLVTPWTTWDTWQYTDKGSVEWCKGPIDLNRRVVYNHDVPLES